MLRPEQTSSALVGHAHAHLEGGEDEGLSEIFNQRSTLKWRVIDCG